MKNKLLAATLVAGGILIGAGASEIIHAQVSPHATRQAFQTDLQNDFQAKLSPIIQQVAVDKKLHMLFSVADSGMVWADPSLDITNDVIAKFDAAPASTAAPAATVRPAGPAAPRPAAPAPARPVAPKP